MGRPIVAPAPVISGHAVVFRDLYDNQGQLRASFVIGKKS